MQLSDFLGGDSVTGGKLKTAGTLEDSTGWWHSPNTGATDEFGFKGLPGGIRSAFPSDGYREQGINGYYWSASPNMTMQYIRILKHNSTEWLRYGCGIQAGISVRCLKDE